MASSKDTFEPHSFGGNTFAAGVFRGTGADAAVFPPGGRVPAALVYCPGAAQAAVGSPGGAVGHVYTPGAAAVEVEG